MLAAAAASASRSAETSEDAEKRRRGLSERIAAGRKRSGREGATGSVATSDKRVGPSQASEKSGAQELGEKPSGARAENRADGARPPALLRAPQRVEKAVRASGSVRVDILATRNMPKRAEAGVRPHGPLLLLRNPQQQRRNCCDLDRTKATCTGVFSAHVIRPTSGEACVGRKWCSADITASPSLSSTVAFPAGSQKPLPALSWRLLTVLLPL